MVGGSFAAWCLNELTPNRSLICRLNFSRGGVVGPMSGAGGRNQGDAVLSLKEHENRPFQLPSGEVDSLIPTLGHRHYAEIRVPSIGLTLSRIPIALRIATKVFISGLPWADSAR